MLTRCLMPECLYDGAKKGSPVGECLFWQPGDDFPQTKSPISDIPIDAPGPWVNNPGWELCIYDEIPLNVFDDEVRAPFTQEFGSAKCEVVGLEIWDRSERGIDDRGGSTIPVVSPSLGSCNPSIKICDELIFRMCNEVNVIRFGERVVFGTPSFGEEASSQSLLITVTRIDDPDDEVDDADGWATLDFGLDDDHVDWAGLVGLPVTGFAAYEFANGFVVNADGDDVKAFYGGTFDHKGNVRRVRAPLTQCGDELPDSEPIPGCPGR